MTARYIVTAASTLVVKMETEKERKGMTDNEYKAARASIEGWFPKVAWGELNQTWASLGQLLNKKDARKKLQSMSILSQSRGPAFGEPPIVRP
jgi:hypothetical protein